jgi:hypothetical protein
MSSSERRPRTPVDEAAVLRRWGTREGALGLLDELRRTLARAPSSLESLRSAVEDWSDPVAIDDRVRELLDGIDPLLEAEGPAVVATLRAIQTLTSRQAARPRRSRTTGRRRVR